MIILSTEHIMKPVPSRTMSSMMSTLKHDDRSGDSSNLGPDSGSSDESEGKVELFKSLKFSDDALKQMNAKRQEIVGSRKIMESNNDANTETNLGRELNHNIAKSTTHIEIGSPLPRQRLIHDKNVENNKSDDEKDQEHFHVRTQNHLAELKRSSVHTKAIEQANEGNIQLEVQRTEKTKMENDNNDERENQAINDVIPSINFNAVQEEKEKAIESLKKTYDDEINAFKISLEEDLVLEKELLTKKFQAEIAEEMRRMEDKRFEKLKDYEVEMTKKLHRELDEFKDKIAKELEEKKKEILENQDKVLKELAKSSNTKIASTKISNQSNNEIQSNLALQKDETIKQLKEAKSSNAKTKDIGCNSNAKNTESNLGNNYPSPFSKQLEDLEKDIRKLRTQMGSGGGGSVSDYSSFSDGAEIEHIQANSNSYGEERNVSPDIESIVTYTEEDDVNAERNQNRYPYRNRSSHNGVDAWPPHENTNNGHRVSQSFVGEHIQTGPQQHQYHYNNRGKLFYTVNIIHLSKIS